MALSLDIQFKDVSYIVENTKNSYCCYKGDKNDSRTVILQNVSGHFKAGELTAVLGPSGAGKTSLINILAGFRTSGVEGEILLNGRERAEFGYSRQLCCLIPQDIVMLDVLTLNETIHIASLLRLGTKHPARKEKIKETCTLLGLDGCLNTTISNLSGGEKKRLSCAVELLSNPPLMFFDEPTSGLDACSAHQVMSHLQGLAHRDNRNIICSIHQPGSRLFLTFDSVYVLTLGGKCLLKGARKELVESLEQHGFQCPPLYNPAEFVLEVARGEHGDITRLIESCIPETYLDIQIAEESKESNKVQLICIDSNKDSKLTIKPICTGWEQFNILLLRAIKCNFRDLHMAKLRFAAHILVGLLLGAIFYKIGQDASTVISNIGCIYFLLLFLFFSNAMPTVHTFPSEMSVLLRENLNGWYSIRYYYLSRSISDLPLQLLCPTIFLIISYLMTGQPYEYRPFFQILLVGLLLTVVAQSMGLLIGAATDVKMGIFLVPVISIPMLLFSGYFVRIDDIPQYFQWISYLSIFRYAFEACLIAIYGYNRERLPCETDSICVIRSPSKILEEFNLNDQHFTQCIIALLLFLIILRILIYIALKCRVIKAQ